MKRYDMLDEQKMDKLLQILPPTANGTLPFAEFAKRAEWNELLKDHSIGSLRNTMTRRWRERPITVTPVKKKLNHAYNFCPSCGLKLN